MTDHSDLITAGVVPMSEHVERFWRYLETETVRVLVDKRREMGNGCVYHDSSSFPDDVAKALVADRKAQSLSLSEAGEEIERLTKQKSLLVRQSNAAIRERDEALAALREKEERVKAAIKLVDGYGIVLTMIAAGCSDPQRFAKRMLAEHDAEAKQLGIVK